MTVGCYVFCARCVFVLAVRLADLPMNREQLMKEVNVLHEILPRLGSPVVFCHNDLILENIVYDELTRQSVTFYFSISTYGSCRRYACYTVISVMYREVQKTKLLCFTACNVTSIDQMGTKFGTNQRYFILSITS